MADDSQQDDELANQFEMELSPSSNDPLASYDKNSDTSAEPDVSQSPMPLESPWSNDQNQVDAKRADDDATNQAWAQQKAAENALPEANASMYTPFDQELHELGLDVPDQSMPHGASGSFETPDSTSQMVQPQTTSQRVGAYIAAKKASGQLPSAASTPDLIKQMLNKYGINSPELNDAALKAAQQDVQNSRLNAGISHAFNVLATASNGQKPDEEFYQSQLANANAPVQNIEARRALQTQNLAQDTNIVKMVDDTLTTQNLQQNSNPNSNAAKAQRAVIAQYHPEFANLPGFNQMSVLDLRQNVIPLMESEAKLKFAKAKIEEANNFKQQAADAKMINDLDPSKASSRTPYGNAYTSAVVANNALGFLNKPTTTVQEAQNIAQDMNRLVTQSNSVTGAHDQQLNTLYGSIQSKLQSISGKPTNAIPQKLKDNLREDIVHLQARANQLIHQHVLTYAAGEPQNKDKILNISRNFDPLVDQPNNPTTLANVPGGNVNQPVQSYDPEVVKYASDHNISPEAANQIKLRRTQGQ